MSLKTGNNVIIISVEDSFYNYKFNHELRERIVGHEAKILKLTALYGDGCVGCVIEIDSQKYIFEKCTLKEKKASTSIIKIGNYVKVFNDRLFSGEQFKLLELKVLHDNGCVDCIVGFNSESFEFKNVRLEPV